MKRVRDAITKDRRMQELDKKILEKNRLDFATRKAVEITVDGGQPTIETISSFIDLKKLLSGCESGGEEERIVKTWRGCDTPTTLVKWLCLFF